MQLSIYLAEERGRAARLAEALSESPAFLSQIASGRRPCPATLAVDIERESGTAVRRWDLRPDDWHRIWPELIGREGAPAVPAPAEKVA